MVREHPHLAYAFAPHPLVHRGDEGAADSAAAPVTSHADLVEEELALVASPAALDVAEEVPDDRAVLLGDPMQHGRIGQVRGRRVGCGRTPRAAAAGKVEGGVVAVELGEERLVAAAEQADAELAQPVRRRRTCGA